MDRTCDNCWHLNEPQGSCFDCFNRDKWKPTDTVTIPATRYEELLRSEKKLCALESGGVDNWEWYGESLREFYKEEWGEED